MIIDLTSEDVRSIIEALQNECERYEFVCARKGVEPGAAWYIKNKDLIQRLEALL